MYTATTPPLCLRHRDVNREDIAEMSQAKTRRSRSRSPVSPPTKGSRKKMYCETEDEHTSPIKKNLYGEVCPSSPYADVRICEEKSPHNLSSLRWTAIFVLCLYLLFLSGNPFLPHVLTSPRELAHRGGEAASGAAVKNRAAANMASNTEAERLRKVNHVTSPRDRVRKHTTHNPQSGAAVKNNAAVNMESNTEALVNMENNVDEANFIETQRKSLTEWGGWSFWRRDTACMSNAAANIESNTDALVNIEHNVHETANFFDSEIESLAEWLKKRTTLNEWKKVMQMEAVKARLQVCLIY